MQRNRTLDNRFTQSLARVKRAIPLMATLMHTEGHARQLGSQNSGPAHKFEDSIGATSSDLICIGLGSSLETPTSSQIDSKRLRTIAQNSYGALFSTGTDSGDETQQVRSLKELKPLKTSTDLGVSTQLNDWYKPTGSE